MIHLDGDICGMFLIIVVLFGALRFQHRRRHHD